MVTTSEILTLPRGSGTITIDIRNKNNPYIARRYDSLDDNGNPRYIYIGSFPNEIEAYLALKDASFKTNSELKSNKFTFDKLYQELLEDEKIMHPSNVKEFQICYRRCNTLYGKIYQSITVFQMQDIINKTQSAVAQRRLRTFFRKLDNIADRQDAITKSRAQFLVVKKNVTSKNIRLPFSNAEINSLLSDAENPKVKPVLVLMYTGFRNGELRRIKKSNVNLTNEYIIGGFKTAAGTNRIIPIHPRILPIIKEWMMLPGEYLLPFSGGNFVSEDKFTDIFHDAVDPISERYHVPHECRHTFRTRLDDQHANEVCIDMLMGHQTPNPVERIYSHKSLEQLREAIMLLW